MTKEQFVVSTIKHQLNVATRDDTNLKLKKLCLFNGQKCTQNI